MRTFKLNLSLSTKCQIQINVALSIPKKGVTDILTSFSTSKPSFSFVKQRPAKLGMDTKHLFGLCLRKLSCQNINISINLYPYKRTLYCAVPIRRSQNRTLIPFPCHFHFFITVYVGRKWSFY